MGGVRKLLLALVAALCAAVLAACGGGDDTTSSTATDATSAEAGVEGGGSSAQGDGGSGNETGDGGKTAGGGGDDGSLAGSGKAGSGGEAPDGGPGGGGSGSGSGGGNSSGGSGGSVGAGFDFSGDPTRHDHPQPAEGERSDVFRVPGGDNSIQEYGEEQGSDERTASMEPIAALYHALFSGDWSEVCSTYLSSKNVKQIELLAQQSPKLRGQSCTQVLGGLNQSVGRTGPDTPDGGIVSFRTEGDTGFAIYWGIDGKGYAFALTSEGGKWKLTSLAPTPLQVG
jgi:hypothetical protein